MRPRTEVRQAIIAAIAQGPCTMRDAAQRAKVGYGVARRTIDNAVRAEEIKPVGREKRAHSKRWCALYEVVDAQTKPATPEAVGAEVLAISLRAWHETPPHLAQFEGQAA